MNNIEQGIKRKIEEVGVPLKDWGVEINYGIKTGFNKAFIIDTPTKNILVKKSPKSEEVIRPILMGKNIKRYEYYWDNLWLINSHNGLKKQNTKRVELEKEYPDVFNFLLQFKEKLVARYDQGDHWSNLRNCTYLEDFSKPKIAWGNLSLRSQFAYIEKNYFINAPSPFFVSDNLYLLAVLNSSIGEFYIKTLGVERSGGYIEFKPMFVEQLPIPKISMKTNDAISSLVSKVLAAKSAGQESHDIEEQIDKKISQIYNLSNQEYSLILDLRTHKK